MSACCRKGKTESMIDRLSRWCIGRIGAEGLAMPLVKAPG
jgi:hypothetical protein